MVSSSLLFIMISSSSSTFFAKHVHPNDLSVLLKQQVEIIKGSNKRTNVLAGIVKKR